MTDQLDIFSAPWKPPGFNENNLTSEELRVFSVMKFHVGRRRAVIVDQIAGMVEMPERKVRDLLKHLTERHGLAIGSSVSGASLGVYLVETAEELEAYCAQLKGRALSALHRMAVLKRQHLGELLGQMRMEAEG